MCGIAGIITSKKTKFDYQTFCTLGLANDSRGGDSVGVFIDGKVTYGKEDKFFGMFFQNNEYLDNIKESQISILHCRKASVGGVSESKAQPVCIYDENNNIEFVLIHNGTIHNYEKLAKKYIPDLDISDLTDSQVMTKIFYKSGYDVLKEYEGSAVFVIIDYRKNKTSPLIFLWKGESKEKNNKLSEERPLYFSLSKSGELVFSSIYHFLLACRYNERIYSLKPNVLYRYNFNKFKKHAEYDRTNCKQYKEYTFTHNITNYYTPNRVSKFNLNDEVLIFDNMYEMNYKTRNGELIHGIYKCSEYGKGTKLSYSEANNEPNVFYFFHGIVMNSKKEYDYIVKKFNNSKNLIKDFVNNNSILLHYLSRNNVINIDNTFYLIEKPDNLIKLNINNYKMFFCSKEITFKNGKFIRINHNFKTTPFNYNLRNINLNEL